MNSLCLQSNLTTGITFCRNLFSLHSHWTTMMNLAHKPTNPIVAVTSLETDQSNYQATSNACQPTISCVVPRLQHAIPWHKFALVLQSNLLLLPPRSHHLSQTTAESRTNAPHQHPEWAASSDSSSVSQNGRQNLDREGIVGLSLHFGQPTHLTGPTAGCTANSNSSSSSSIMKGMFLQQATLANGRSGVSVQVSAWNLTKPVSKHHEEGDKVESPAGGLPQDDISILSFRCG